MLIICFGWSINEASALVHSICICEVMIRHFNLGNELHYCAANEEYGQKNIRIFFLYETASSYVDTVIFSAKSCSKSCRTDYFIVNNTEGCFD